MVEAADDSTAGHGAQILFNCLCLSGATGGRPRQHRRRQVASRGGRVEGLTFSESVLWGVSTIGVIALGTHEVPTRWQVVRAGSDRVWSTRLEAAALVGTGMGLPVMALLILAEVPRSWIVLTALVTLVPAGVLVPISWLAGKIEQLHARCWHQQLTRGSQRCGLALWVSAGRWLAATLAVGALTVILAWGENTVVLLLTGTGVLGSITYLSWRLHRHRRGLRCRAFRSRKQGHHGTRQD